MADGGTSEPVVQYGFPLFWVGVGVLQWFWPAAIFTGVSNEDVTPGARGLAVLWLCFGSVLGLAFVPALEPFDLLVVPGSVLLVVGALQWVHPVWSLPFGGDRGAPDRTPGAALGAGGVGVLLVSLL